MTREDITKYCRHLPTCNIMQDWSEAEQAMADTPERFRDEGWRQAYEEMRVKKNTCTCGLDELLVELLVVPPAEGAEKSCLSCRFHNSPTYHDKMWCRDCQQLSHYKQQSTAEGAEEILEKYPFQQDDDNEVWYEKHDVLAAMQEFATLHARRLAEKMAWEKLREELIAYDKWLNRTRWGMREVLSPEKAVERYLKSKEQWHY